LTDWRSYSADEILRDGGAIRIRAVRPDDGAALRDHFNHLSPVSIHFRFFGMKKGYTPAEIERLTRPDFERNATLVATRREQSDARIIGVGCFMSYPGDMRPSSVEVAFAVVDEFQGRGIGTLLLEHLAVIARGNGITKFEAQVLGGNKKMLEVFLGSGFRVERSLEGGVIHVTLPTEKTRAVAKAYGLRERRAAATSVRGFLEPASVAVVGASRQAGTIGAALMENLTRCGFKGPIYPVNPKAGEIAGLRAYPRVSAIGERVDLAVVAVPAPAVEEAIADCARAGVRGIVLITSGFGEVSAEGREIEARLHAAVRESGMRLVGPNCLGVLNTDPAVALNATFAPHRPPAGNIGMVSQSGALGLALLDRAYHAGMGVSTFVSVGNKADVSGNDLLCYWEEDPRTDVGLMYLESFGNPRRFARIAPAIARRKPLVALKSGRGATGSRAASSHSAALASPDVAVDALFEQAGVIRAETLEEFFDVASLLSCQPLPAGGRVCVVTNAGGPGIILADACEAQGLALPGLSPRTLELLGAFLPDFAALGNPVDLTASATSDQFARAIEAAGQDPSVDSLIAVYVPTRLSRPEDIARAIADAAPRVPATKPLLAVFLSGGAPPRVLGESGRGRIPCFAFPENAARALVAAERYARWRRRPAGATILLDPFARSAIRAVIDRVAARATGPVWLDPADVALILRAVRIPIPAWQSVPPDEAGAASERVGFPLVAKAVAGGLVHKSDMGGVITGLRSREAVEAAARTLADRLKAAGMRLEGVLLQREIAGGVEVLVGVTSDATFGPLVVCGMGGVLAELIGDVAHRLVPVTDTDADEMLGKLRLARLLDGYRGAQPGDRAALARLLRKVSAIAEAAPEIRDMDLNPVRVLEPGKGVIVLDARVRVDPAFSRA
jgi:acetyl coenzyme A synthetase (ADP forming)-like protein